MNKKLVSIIITTHHGSDTILRCVQSVLEQDYEKIETIVVDDNGVGSEEQIKTQEMLASLIEDGRITYKAHKVNKNGSAARNTGFMLSKGEYIGFIDDDDQYLPKKISKSVDILNRLDKSWGGCYTNAVIDKGEAGRFYTQCSEEGDILFLTLCHLIFMNPSTLILKREVVEKVNCYDATFQRHQDFEFNARVANVCKIKHLDFLGSVYNCSTHRHYNVNKAIEYRSYYMRKMKPLISQLPLFKQKIVAARNAIEILGVRTNQYGACKELCNNWGYTIGMVSYIYTLVITFFERKKTKIKCNTDKYAKIKILIRERLNPLFAPIRKATLFKFTWFHREPFTIISNNCWAGHVYRYYNIPYATPTIGLFFFSEDYIKFVYNLREYLSLDFKFITYRESKYRQELEKYGGECLKCPIGILNDIEIIFLHYKSPKEALDKWNRRKARMNLENIYFKMSEMNLCKPEYLQLFDKLPTNKKFVFTTRDYNLKSQVIFGDYYLENSISDDTTKFRKYIDLNAFLTGKQFKKRQILKR